MKGMTTAVEMARSRCVDPKNFRRALRAANLMWHSHNGRWSVPIGSPEHQDMERVLTVLAGGYSQYKIADRQDLAGPASTPRTTSDEAWIIDLCDKVLGTRAIRQHRFPFLLGDPGSSGRRATLPVDAFYPDLGLVIEYQERQHTSSVPFFDKRKTVSGVGRGEQRRLYDRRRREVLPQHGYKLIVLDYTEFKCTSGGRLIRDKEAEDVVGERLRGERPMNPT